MLNIIKPGLLTTIQDSGRYGFQKDGVIVSGAMDLTALRIANLLVGNDEGDAALEITLLGPSIFFEEDHLIAITGADLSPTVSGKEINLARPVFVRKGNRLNFGNPKKGCRAYLAVAGGFSIPKIMGSYATYLRAGIGGLGGRALQSGDQIPCNKPSSSASGIIKDLEATQITKPFVETPWYVAQPIVFPINREEHTIRVVRGPEYDLFSESSKGLFRSEKFKIMPQSDRMGYRLQGPMLEQTEKTDFFSSAVTFGTIQVPPEGHPIVLLADHQTTGGYPRIAQVITADFSIVTQLPPGKEIRFKEVSLQEAQQLYMAQEQLIEQIKRALYFKNRKRHEKF